jgi:NADPH:quinone reductase-like Zn-dependent oxidoreductase
MKAAQISEYGGGEVLQFTSEAARPPLGKSQVLVEVHAAAINPFDVKVREGLVQSMAALTFPATLGGDFAGVITEIGDEVTDFTVGQAVYGQAGALSGNGSFAEFAPAKAASIALKPESVDFVTAAAYPLVTVSAYQALVDHMVIQTGQKILIHGGAGGIGVMAIQLAHHFGAHVTTTSSAADIDFVKSLGANEVIDYQTQDFAAVLSDMDAVYDTVGGETNQKSYGILKPGGALVSMVVPENEALLAQHDIKYTYQFTKVTTERLQEVAKLIDAGDLIINVDKVFPLEQAAEGLEYLKMNHPRGKVVIQVQ